MANIFTLENIDDFSEKINIDDLYEKKRQYDLNKLVLFNKILNRIHVRIKTTSRQKMDENFCWYLIPEIMIGVPKYDQGACIAYILNKLKENKFVVRYIHPNTLFISWQHWVPGYVRTELKNKTGIIIDEFGNKVGEDGLLQNSIEATPTQTNPNDIMFNTKNILSNTSSSQKPGQPQKKFTPINSYKPTGSLVYNEDLLNHLEDKFT